MKVSGKVTGDNNVILTFEPNSTDASLESRSIEWIQTQACVQNLIAVHKYGAVIMPASVDAQYLSFKIGGVKYTSNSQVGTTAAVGDTVTFTRDDYINDALSALSITNVTLTPSFAAGTLTYTGATANASGTLTATKADSDAEMTV